MKDETNETSALGNDCEICGRSEESVDGVLSQLSPRAARYMLHAAAKCLAPDKRIFHCLRTPTREAEQIRVMRGERNIAYFHGLQTCGSVWDCAICSAKISERRAAELNGAVNKWLSETGYIFLATYTLAHSKADPLPVVLRNLREAYRAMKAARGFKKAKAEMNYRHDVTALEVTYGRNGWHPHLHALIFTDPAFTEDVNSFKAEAQAQWQRALYLRSASAAWDIGFKLQSGNYAANYAAKWGAVREVTNAANKRGRVGGRTPAQLLASYAIAGDTEAGELWKQYSAAFHGRSQLQWSRGAKAALGLADVSDAELAEAADDNNASQWAEIDLITWRFIANAHPSIKPRILAACEADNRAEFDSLIQLALATGK